MFIERFSWARVVAAAEFQHFECEPSEYNQKYFTLIQFPLARSLKFEISHSTVDDGWVSALECAWVCSQWSAVSMKDSSSPHSAGREEWAAVELRTLIPFTTVWESHQVCTKCCWALLLWKGPLSGVSFQVSYERDTIESQGQLACVWMCVCVFCMCGPVRSLV